MQEEGIWPDGNSARNYAYTTSPENRILGLTESVASTATETWGYGYDLADRLVNALATPSGAYTYGLDAGDNLLTVQTPASSTTSTYNSLNQVTARNAQPFVYDAAGNLLNDGRLSYTWDAEQRLIAIGYLATPAVSTILRYDGLGRRTAVIENDNSSSTETRYLWCGERICQARNASDGVIRRYYDEGEQQIGTNITPYYYAQDHLGSVRDLVDASGNGLAAYDYDPYGRSTRSTASGSTRADCRYAGLFYHAPSGLYLTHYRAYDPVTARWLSRDPIEEGGGVNLYTYVYGNPVGLVDPLGLRPPFRRPKLPKDQCSNDCQTLYGHLIRMCQETGYAFFACKAEIDQIIEKNGVGSLIVASPPPTATTPWIARSA